MIHLNENGVGVGFTQLIKLWSDNLQHRYCSRYITEKVLEMICLVRRKDDKLPPQQIGMYRNKIVVQTLHGPHHVVE